MDTKQRCKKCLLYELDEKSTYESVYRYIAQIEPEAKVDDSTYQGRLQQCRECEFLLSGMCRICGCFVEMRAIMKKNSCPGSNKKW